MLSYEQIFETEEPWPDGPGILTDIVVFLKDKHFVAYASEARPGDVTIVLPMPQFVDDGGKLQNVLYLVPERLRLIFSQRWEMIAAARQANVLTCVRMHLNEDLTQALVIRINHDLREQEQLLVASGEPPIWELVAANFGLNPYDLPTPAEIAK